MPPNGLVMLMLETATGIDRAAQILAVPGVAGVFVGPADLAVSLGLPPSEVAHDKVLEKCATVVAICAELGLVAGIGSHSVEHARTWVEMGFGMVSIGRDVSMMRDVAADRLSQIRMTPRRPGR
jgi:2-keto-3-deoxy-L-rhamnonate aldolase RhmA